MKTTIKSIIIILMLSNINYSIVAQEKSDKRIEFNLEVHKYTDNVALIQTDKGNASQLILNTDKGLVIFGTQWASKVMKKYLEKINTVFVNKEVKYIINDSHRIIYTAGNYLFQDATIIAQQDVYNKILRYENNIDDELQKEINLFSAKAIQSANFVKEEERSEESKENYRDWGNFCQRMADDLKAGFILKKPNVVYKQQLRLDLDNMTLELTQNPWENGGMFIWIPEEGILKTNFFHQTHIINRGIFPREKEDIEELLGILDEFVAKGDQVEQVVLWFAGTWTIDKVKERTDYLHLLWDEVQLATTANLSFETVEEQLSLDNKFSYVKDWPLYNEKKEIDGGLEFEHSLLMNSLWRVLHPSIYQYMLGFVQQNDADKGIAELKNILKKRQNDYFIDERGMNGLGYQFLSDSKMELALEVFKAYVNLYPNSANAYDSLGETYMNNGDTKNAIINYEKSLALNPANNNAKEMLKKLKS